MEGADAVCHGCTGKGNDQVRFELHLPGARPAPDRRRPWREWHIKSREDAIEYATAHGVQVDATKDQDLLGRRQPLAHVARGGLIEDPWNEPPATPTA
jgi:argininosuccinate synthase